MFCNSEMKSKFLEIQLQNIFYLPLWIGSIIAKKIIDWSKISLL